jgi:heme a synthase
MDGSGFRSRRRFGQYAVGVLAYNIFVVLWGAFVRATGSGAGCGDRWPFCNGTVVPHSPAMATVIEFMHRVTSGIDIALVIGMCAWAFYLYPRRHVVRRMTILSLVFLLVEAILGAGLVLLRYVAKDESAGRAWYLSAHLTNTMLLLAVLTVTAWVAWTGVDYIRLHGTSRPLLWTLPVTLAVGITGAIAALGDTLFPAASFASGFHQDFSSTSSWLLRLRLLHPAIAILGAAYLIWVTVPVLRRRKEDSVGIAAARVLGITCFQLGVGAMNVTLLAPVWMQIFHLFMADVLWIAVAVMVLESGRVRASAEELTVKGPPAARTRSSAIV